MQKRAIVPIPGFREERVEDSQSCSFDNLDGELIRGELEKIGRIYGRGKREIELATPRGRNSLPWLGELDSATPCLNQLDTSISFFPAKVFGPDLNALQTGIRRRRSREFSRKTDCEQILEIRVHYREGDNRSEIQVYARFNE